MAQYSNLIIDGDFLIYKGAFSAETKFYRAKEAGLDDIEFNSKKEALEHQVKRPGCIIKHVVRYKEEGLARYYTKMAMEKVLNNFPGAKFRLYISAPKGYNVRYDIAKTCGYKNTRPERPKYYEVCRQYLLKEWGAVEIGVCEADDAVAIAATAIPECVIVHIDKDINQVPGVHYHPDKQEIYTVDEEDGLRNLYFQILTGDKIDTVPGMKVLCRARTCGEMAARKLLENCKTEKEMKKAVKEHVFKYSEDLTEERYKEVFEEMYDLLYLPRTKKQLEDLKKKYGKES